MKCAVFSALIASAAAFAPVEQGFRSTTHLNSDAAADEPASSEFCRGYVGNTGPEPILFFPGYSTVDFDPLGFTTKCPDWVPWFREAELKHGRAAMLATVGFVVPEFVRIPGEQFSFEAIPKVIDAHDALADTAMIQIFGWISFVEACTFGALANMNEFDREPGDYGFDPLGLMPLSEEGQKEMRTAELKNGRLAMCAIGGMVMQASITGNGFPYLFNMDIF